MYKNSVKDKYENSTLYFTCSILTLDLDVLGVTRVDFFSSTICSNRKKFQIKLYCDQKCK